ncbi:MAG: undecaprenyl-phosphate glucose phosphotransferase [Pseudomonadota bacterium]
MLKKHHQFFASMLWLADMAVVLLSFTQAYYLRFFWQGLFPARWGVSPVEETRALLFAILVIWTVVLRLTGLYVARRTARLSDEAFLLLKASVIAVVCLVSVFYFFRDVRYSRLTIGLFSSLSFVNLTLARMLLRRVLRALRRRGLNLRHALVVGCGESARALIRRLDEDPALGVNVLGVLSSGDGVMDASIEGKPVLGRYEDVAALVSAHEVDQVYIAVPLTENPRVVELLHLLSEELVDIKVVPDLMQYVTLRGGIEDLAGLPIVHLQIGPAVGWDAVIKRVFDLVFASLFLVLVSPVIATVSLLIKLTSPGPVFFRQERMGLDGRTFQMLKFRSMRTDAENATGAVWAQPDDDRTTWMGRWLRRFSIDELPQFLNVLRGDMSLVGPRPERPVLIAQFKKRIPHYNLRHKVKAGITGLAQVEGWRGQTSLEKRIERDLYYIENWSLWLDLKILIRTALGGFLSRNAY